MNCKAEEDKMIRFQVTLNPDIIERLKTASKKTGSSKSEIIRRALNEYIKKYYENE